MKRLITCLLTPIILTGAIQQVAVAAGDEVIVVMSSDSRPYKEALAGFQKNFNHPVTVKPYSEALSLSGETRLVVAIGGKAALHSYPANVTLLYAMVPGLVVNRPSGRAVRIQSLPAPATLLAKFRNVQPNLKWLAVFWSSESTGSYLQDLEKAAAPLHMDIISISVGDPKELPKRLRAMTEHADALWLTPDPLLVTPESFAVLKEYALAKRIPFYAPTGNLASLGAAASVSASYAEVGRTAAQTAEQLLSAGTTTDDVYPEKAEVTLNPTVIAQIGMPMPSLAQ